MKELITIQDFLEKSNIIPKNVSMEDRIRLIKTQSRKFKVPSRIILSGVVYALESELKTKQDELFQQAQITLQNRRLTIASLQDKMKEARVLKKNKSNISPKEFVPAKPVILGKKS